MPNRINLFIFIFIIYVIVDIYSYFGFKSMLASQKSIWIMSIIYFAISLLSYYAFYEVFKSFTKGNPFTRSSANLYLGFFITIFVGKLFFGLLVIIQDFVRLFFGIILFFSRSSIVSSISDLPPRRSFITMLSAGIAAIPFFGMLYGITLGKYRYIVENVSLSFLDLPKAFDGFSMVQISDIHAGSYDNPQQVEKAVERINALNPDVILFTGDLVNAQKEEIDPYISIFKKMNAKYGKFAVLGNHDYYGLYGIEGQKAKDKYWQEFMLKYEALDLKLLNNEHILLEKEGESICIAGVENWGKGRWFPKYGDLNKALQNAPNPSFTVLMSHDPTHWDEAVLSSKRHVHLTLSGHTHGFQFGIKMPGFQWSPAKYRYPRWLGLYEENGKYLYVNRGLGFLAFPGRVGMWPEITQINLRSLA